MKSKVLKRITAAVLAAAMLSALAGCSGKGQDTGNAPSQAVTSGEPSDSSNNGGGGSNGTAGSSGTDGTAGTAGTAGGSQTAGGADGAVQKESPILAAQVTSGELPPLSERIPETPKLLNELAERHLNLTEGQYGGTLRMATTATASVGEFQVAMMEPLVNSPSFTGEEFVANVAESFEISDDASAYTFTLRKGMKWSDGEPVTTEDVEFAVNDVMFHTDITSVFPNNYRTGGSASGSPMTLEIVDEYTFKLSFDAPYEGFLVKLALQGWPSYYELIKPAHYLKQYHKDYLDAAAFDALLKENNTQADQWGVLFNDFDITSWELGSPKALGFPLLTPWIPLQYDDTKITLVRNPYYFKVDASGRQMPYIDYGEVYYVNDAEVMNNMIIAGQVDYANGEMSKMQIYKANESNGYTTRVANYHGRLGNIYYNHNYEDEDWQQAINDVRFRKALSLATDREQIIDTVFYGLGTLPDQVGCSEFNLDEANRLLDEMGLDQRGTDGYRLYPSGKPVEIFFEISSRVPENLPITEMLVLMLQKAGINAGFKSVDVSLFNEQRAANKVQAFVERMETYWWMGDAKFIYWCPMWDNYYQTDGASGMKPPAEVVELMDDARDTTSLPLADEAPAAYEKLCAGVKEQYRYIPIMDFSQMPLILNSKLGNTDFQGDLTTIILNFTLEQMYFTE